MLRERLAQIGDAPGVHRLIAMPWCANSAPALQKTGMVIDYDHNYRMRHHIRVRPRGESMPPRAVGRPNRQNLVRHERTTNGSSPGETSWPIASAGMVSDVRCR